MNNNTRLSVLFFTLSPSFSYFNSGKNTQPLLIFTFYLTNPTSSMVKKKKKKDFFLYFTDEKLKRRAATWHTQGLHASLGKCNP